MSVRMPFAEVGEPRTIGKYVVSQRIGAGAMGVVYKALDPHIRRTVAIKTIRPRLLEPGALGAAALQRFRLEAQAAGRLHHPNIVAIHDYGESGDELFIVMEHVEGRSLHAITSQGRRLALADALAVMVQLLDALHCAHEQRVWHCDVKPANLLVTRDGRLKVTDFGIACIDVGGVAQRGAVFGSPGYMAPERYRGEPADARVDVFACGVLLYELLTGSAPFGGDLQTAREQVLHHEPAPPSARAALPAALDAVVARALAKRPAERFASALELRDALLEAAPPDGVRHALSAEALVQMRRTPTGAQALPSTPQAASTPSIPSTPLPCSLPLAPTLHLPAYAPTVVCRPERGEALHELEALLLPLLGPLARIVVRDAARRGGTLAAVVARIAAEALRGDERADFLARAARIAGAAPPPGPVPGDVPVLGQTPLRPETVERAARLLAAEIGPIALTLARRAAASASSCEQFFCSLAASVHGEFDRKRLLARLWEAEPGA